MKVNVLQAADVKIKTWRWWSDWIDVAVFDWTGYGYLLQMRVSRTNAKRFKAVAFRRALRIPHPGCSAVGDLTQMQARKDG